MKELPSPTLPLSLPVQMSRGTLHQPAQAKNAATAAPGIRVSWAQHQDEVRQAQRLRYQVFAEEMGARLSGPLPGHDIDLFDDYCEHLLVRDTASDAVIGTYRVLTPAQAARIGSFYTDLEFDLTRLRGLRSRMVELGRSCVHAEHRQGGVILALWGALTQFMVRNQLDVMIGCASIGMQHQGLPGGHAAASIWRQLRATHLAPPGLPRLAALAFARPPTRPGLGGRAAGLDQGLSSFGRQGLGPAGVGPGLQHRRFAHDDAYPGPASPIPAAF
jgi:putative hemolysin